ncbi:pyridoxal-phosphate dependent enzyme [Sphingomonas naphthae]|uniref:Pyridoxal-phosphate dependent enzyme n=1 Tax=Sphingomonas naphthae TaxID=1813468 RepID=A0ABY7TJP2_9SPHN|nr:pyridoxal-phosphate dependent enzyme [Sphingomonas naphthae]WCT73170.1 pyridoxal-phosphate dependent enzyme [Sphingomonas naphthae]
MNAINRQKPAPSTAGVIAAAARLGGVASVTPLLPLPGWPGVWLKAESLQLGGAFKFRGAYNRLVQIAQPDRPRGVVAFSSGNHAQGVARAAAMLRMPAAIVMPADAPAVKRDATAALGAEIIPYDRETESREAIAAALAEARGAVLVPSFDDVDVVEGQGSAGIEAAAQLAALGAGPIGRIVTPCGGGGLASGLALAVPGAEMIVVEPEGWDDMGRSLVAGHIVPVEPGAPATACDALQTTRVADITFGVLQAAGARGLWVSEAEVRAAIRHAFGLGMVVEPGGAVALAAVLAGKVPADGTATMVMLSGSNIDPADHARVMAG